MRPTFGLRPLTSPFRQVYIVPICILCEPIASNKTIYHYSHFTHFTLIKQSLLTGEGRRDKRKPDAITNWDFPYANLNVLNEYFFSKRYTILFSQHSPAMPEPKPAIDQCPIFLDPQRREGRREHLYVLLPPRVRTLRLAYTVVWGNADMEF